MAEGRYIESKMDMVTVSNSIQGTLDIALLLVALLFCFHKEGVVLNRLQCASCCNTKISQELFECRM